MRAECFDRVIDPWTNKPVAAWGWLQERKELPGKYWVSIENRPYEFFTREDYAREFYYTNTRLLRAKLNQRRARGPQKRIKRQVLAASAGK